MNFELDDLHRSIRETARAFAQKEVAPYAAQWDREDRFPKEIIPKLGELGFMGIRVPEEYGGSGLSTLAYAIIVEEIARVDGSLALTVASHNGLGTSHILHFASDELKKKYLPKLATGEWLGAWALTEPGSGSDAGSMLTRAVRDGNDWIINGSKNFITQGSVGGVCVVLARTNPDKGNKGVTAFAIEHGTPGFNVSKHIEKLGMCSSDTVELNFQDCRVPDTQRVGELDNGFIDTLKILDRGRISIGALALGLGEGALSEALKYGKERKQFGKPITEFQAIQWMLADSRMELDASRWLLWRAALIADTGKRYGKEAALAKLYTAQAASRVCNRAVQIHGGYGYTRDFPVERMLRDAKLCEIGEGTNEVQKMVISRHLLA